MVRTSRTTISIGVALALVAAVLLAIVIRPDSATEDTSQTGSGLGIPYDAQNSDDSESALQSSLSNGGRTDPSSGKPPPSFPSDGQPVSEGLSCPPGVCPIAEAGMRINCQCDHAGLFRHQWTYDETGRLAHERYVMFEASMFEDYYEDGVLRTRAFDYDGDGNVDFRMTYDENGRRAMLETV